MNEVEGKVIRIVDKTALIINIGIADGVHEGDHVTIVERGDKIKDLDGQDLGYYDFEKATLTITHAQLHFSEVKDIKTKNTSSYATAIGELQKAFTKNILFNEHEYYDDLNIDKEKIEPLEKADMNDEIIHKGDVVVFYTSKK